MYKYISTFVVSFFLLTNSVIASEIVDLNVDAIDHLEHVEVKKRDVILNDTDFDLTFGKPESKIKIVDYSSFTCPHCANFYLNVLTKLPEAYSDNSTLQVVHRDFPLDRGAYQATILSHCSPNIEKSSITKLIYAKQNDWAWPNKVAPGLADIANLIGLGSSEYERCLQNKDLEARLLDHNMTIIKELKLDGTPAIFINGYRYKGPHSVESLSSVIDEVLRQLNDIKSPVTNS